MRTYDPDAPSFQPGFPWWPTQQLDHLRRLQRVPEPREILPKRKTPNRLVSETPPIPRNLLTARQASIMALLYEQELDVSDVAELLGITEQTVRSAHHKAITRLRDILRKSFQNWQDESPPRGVPSGARGRIRMSSYSQFSGAKSEKAAWLAVADALRRSDEQSEPDALLLAEWLEGRLDEAEAAPIEKWIARDPKAAHARIVDLRASLAEEAPTVPARLLLRLRAIAPRRLPVHPTWFVCGGDCPKWLHWRPQSRSAPLAPMAATRWE